MKFFAVAALFATTAIAGVAHPGAGSGSPAIAGSGSPDVMQVQQKLQQSCSKYGGEINCCNTIEEKEITNSGLLSGVLGDISLDKLGVNVLGILPIQGEGKGCSAGLVDALNKQCSTNIACCEPHTDNGKDGSAVTQNGPINVNAKVPVTLNCVAQQVQI